MNRLIFSGIFPQYLNDIPKTNQKYVTFIRLLHCHKFELDNVTVKRTTQNTLMPRTTLK